MLHSYGTLGYTCTHGTVAMHTVKVNTMNRHSLHYIDLNPAKPVDQAPGLWPQVAGACVAMATVWVATLVLFSL